VPLFAGLVLGLAAGYGLAVYASGESPAAGSPFLREFSFAEAARNAAAAEWEVVHDRTAPVLLGRSRRIARRFVARATLSQRDVQPFAQRFDQSVEEALPHQSGEENLDRATVSADSSRLLQLPRYHYRTDAGDGVVDAGIVAEGGEVTVIVSMIE
jgi:hypothetical protein